MTEEQEKPMSVDQISGIRVLFYILAMGLGMCISLGFFLLGAFCLALILGPPLDLSPVEGEIFVAWALAFTLLALGAACSYGTWLFFRAHLSSNRKRRR